MPEIEEKPVWEKQYGEPKHQYAAFVIYRDLGPTRSVSDAVRVYLKAVSGEIPLREKARSRQEQAQAKFAVHPTPDKYINWMSGAWSSRWARKWDWTGRCDAFDAFNEVQATLRRDADRRAAENAAEQKLQDLRERRLNAILGGGEVAIAYVTRMMELVGQGALKNIPMETRKHTDISETHRAETKTLGMAEGFPIAVALLDKLQQMELAHRGMPGRTIRVVHDTKKLEAVVEMIRDMVPPEKWEEVLARLGEIDKLPADTD